MFKLLCLLGTAGFAFAGHPVCKTVWDERSVAPKDFVRTDSTNQKLDKFLVQNGVDKKTSTVTENGQPKVAPPCTAPTPEWRECKLSSVRSLRKELQEQCSDQGRTVFAGHTFVGCVSRKFALFQHSTKLYLANTSVFSQHLFRQLLLRDFGNIGVLKLDPPAPLKDLALLALDL